jgi:aerobic-type carbon monoxide dehydrogenase small subunit (CoxS/CutS family)
VYEHFYLEMKQIKLIINNKDYDFVVDGTNALKCYQNKALLTGTKLGCEQEAAARVLWIDKTPVMADHACCSLRRQRNNYYRGNCRTANCTGCRKNFLKKKASVVLHPGMVMTSLAFIKKIQPNG